MPPVVTNYVASSSSSSPYESSGESKEAELESDEDSVSDVYMMDEDSEATGSISTDQYSQIAQPDPDGVRLEDGRQYREQWNAHR